MRSLPLVLILGVTTAGCSIRGMAVRSFADVLAESGDTFAADDDPQLVREAIPFALKTYESLLAASPEHRALLVATARGFTQYAYGFLQRDAELLEETDLEAGLAERRRARRLLIRGRDYGLRALELERPGIGAALRVGDLSPIAELGPDQVPALFWTGAAWGGAIAILKDDADLIGDLPVVEALLRRVIALEEDFDGGAAHELMMTLEAGLVGGSIERAREHFRRAEELSGGRSASPLVTYAETVLVKEQDRAGFLAILERALAIDVAADRSLRLANVLAQERARWLRGRVEELFLE